MVFGDNIKELEGSVVGLIRRIGRIKTFRRQSITLIEICRELQDHLKADNPQGDCKAFESIQTAVKSRAGDSDPCELGTHGYQARMTAAENKDTIRERIAAKLLRKNPRELSKGHRGRQVTLSQNPRLYCDFISPYKTVENFNLNPTEEDAPEPILRKKPEADMENFRGTKRPVIHVYFDASPLIILEVTYRRRSFSLAKWDKSTSLILLRDRVNGALYTGIDLMRLIFYSNLSERAQNERMNNWPISKSISSAEPAFHPSPLASTPRNEELSSAERLRTMLEGLLAGAGPKSTEKLDEIYRISVRIYEQGQFQQADI
ncbi:hypothetical protein FS749_001379 [Ceratobasidium sp. UAMH 11750]|nr:hypothetical protein FS749_001379 [Ceratobasidium sp. UAMH 11750]